MTIKLNEKRALVTDSFLFAKEKQRGIFSQIMMKVTFYS